MAQVIRLNETQLRRMISELVYRALNEGSENDMKWVQYLEPGEYQSWEDKFAGGPGPDPEPDDRDFNDWYDQYVEYMADKDIDQTWMSPH